VCTIQTGSVGKHILRPSLFEAKRAYAIPDPLLNILHLQQFRGIQQFRGTLALSIQVITCKGIALPDRREGGAYAHCFDRVNVLALRSRANFRQGRVEHLRDVKKVYVGSFGNEFGADVIRNKLISHPVKSGRIEVVEKEEQADAILTGAGQVSANHVFNASSSATGGSAHGSTHDHATAGVRLLNRESKILWADDTSSGMFARSASSGLADKLLNAFSRRTAEDENAE